MIPGKWYRISNGAVYYCCGFNSEGRPVLQPKGLGDLVLFDDKSQMVEVHDAESWPLGVMVMCRDSDAETSVLRPFAGIKDGRLMAFKGASSANAIDPEFRQWLHMRLATQEEIKEHTKPLPEWCAKPKG